MMQWYAYIGGVVAYSGWKTPIQALQSIDLIRTEPVN